MRMFSIVRVLKISVSFCIFTLCSISFAQDAKSPDRSGLEISSILQSEIKVLKYEDSSVSYQISRDVRGSKRFKVVSMDRGGSVRTPHSVPSAKVLRILNGFSCIRAKNRVPSDPSQEELGKIELSDFSDLEPQEYIFYKTKDNKIILRLYENESYFVDLPMALFRKAKTLLR